MAPLVPTPGATWLIKRIRMKAAPEFVVLDIVLVLAPPLCSGRRLPATARVRTTDTPRRPSPRKLVFGKNERGEQRLGGTSPAIIKEIPPKNDKDRRHLSKLFHLRLLPVLNCAGAISELLHTAILHSIPSAHGTLLPDTSHQRPLREDYLPVIF